MALLLRLHSPHKSLPCKGESQLINYHILIRQPSLASSASVRHFRLHPVLGAFVSRVAHAAALAATHRVLARPTGLLPDPASRDLCNLEAVWSAGVGGRRGGLA